MPAPGGPKRDWQPLRSLRHLPGAGGGGGLAQQGFQAQLLPDGQHHQS